MADVAVPGGLADITTEWMTAVLRGRGLDVEVASVTPARGSEGSGVNGVTERLFIDYARGGEGAPGSLVVKLPSMSAAVKGVAIRQRFYHNEIYFYEDFADKATVKIPQYYYGGIDDERQNFALLMQDMTPAVVGDDIGSCTKAEAILAVREIPKLHAPWWENPALDTFEWLPVGEPNLAVADARFANEVLPGVMRNYGDTLSPKVRGIVERYCSNFTETILKMCTSPRTLTHSDYRLTNMLFGGPPEARVITVVDWQRVAIARGPVDVAFFAVLSLTPELRRAWERELVEQYHDALMEEGVRDYSLEECWRDYRLCAIGPSRITLSFAARPREDMGGAHLLELQHTLVTRVSAAMEDLDMEEFV